ncbi:hypothetical protein [Rhodococcus marinonascens]|uniref:hypothetical protein n=1 Tax=Rhodococcus marinonascens TaxID=38311 RepID=UPI000933BA7A|nr:hypothetical protein [Rhodococcus marinonascens]
MKKSVRTAATAVLAAPLLAAVFAAPASVDEHDDLVTLTAVADGSDVTITITNGHDMNVDCTWTAVNAADDTADLEGEGTVRDEDVTLAFTETGVADGSYTVTWACDREGTEWGTEGENATALAPEFTIGTVAGTGSSASVTGVIGNLISLLPAGS